MKRAVLFAFLVSACASTYTPVVDLKDVDTSRYQTDLAECREYGEEVTPTDDPVVTALLLTAALAALGAIAGAADNDVSVAEGAGALGAFGAGLGALGVAGAAAGGNTKQARIIQNCLEGRGYKVLARADAGARERS